MQPITKYESTAQYINIAQYKLDNGGIFKHSPENAEVVSKDEVQSIASVYHNNAQVYVQRFNKWICKNTITEYKNLSRRSKQPLQECESSRWFVVWQ